MFLTIHRKISYTEGYMFNTRTKFKSGAVYKKIKFAFRPTYIDGGVKRIWLGFYYQFYVRTAGHLNWELPDTFSCEGSYSLTGSQLKFNRLKEENALIHWASEDKNYYPKYLQTKN